MASVSLWPRAIQILQRPKTLLTVVSAVAFSLLGIMLPWLYIAGTGFLALARPSSAAADDGIDTTWHAPASWSVNNLTKALNSDGVYGFIFDTSQTPDAKYGTYNYCNMPHVRAKEYVRASDEYELQYVELIHRHHKRTPYADNSFPVESYQWNCDDQALYFYGQPFEGHEAAHGYRNGVVSNINPFVPSGFIGSCQFPQITEQGLDDSWQHGADLYGVYHDLLGFLPGKGDDFASKIKYRVTNNVITHQVAGMVANGMYGITDNIPLHVEAPNVDSLEPQYSCPTSDDLFNAIKSSQNAEWQRHLDETQDLFSVLDDISGVAPDNSGFHVSFDHYFDNLSSRQCHDKPLPCKLVDGTNSTTCVTQEMADTVYRLGHWEYSQIYRDNSSSFPASANSFGVWAAQLAHHFRDVVNGESETIYLHNVAHDGSVSRLLGLLQVDEMVWPGMGAEILFELYKKKDKTTEPPKPTSTVIAPDCSHNNCLRQMIRSSESASSLCPTFTSSAVTALPTWPSACDDVKQISSACSCLDPAAPTGTPTPPPSESGYYVRVFFGGAIFKSSNPTLGAMDMLPLETLLAYLDDLAGKDASSVKSNCGSS